MKVHICFIQFFGRGEAEVDSYWAVTSFSIQDLGRVEMAGQLDNVSSPPRDLMPGCAKNKTVQTDLTNIAGI